MTWLYVPFLCVQESEDSTSESRSPSQTLSASATWRGKAGPPSSWQRRLKAGRFPLLRSTLTLPLSTVVSGAERWISSLPDCPASHSVLPAGNAETGMSASSGMSSSGSSMRSGPPLSSSRTCQVSSQRSLWDTDPMSESSFARWKPPRRVRETLGVAGTPVVTSSGYMGDLSGSSASVWRSMSPQHWKAVVTGWRREYSARLRSVRHTGGSGSSAWPTATTQDFKKRGPNSQQQGLNSSVTKDWKTPHGIANTDRFGKAAGGGGEFAKQATGWSTPHAHNCDGAPGAGHLERGGRNRDLVVETETWATPTSRDHKDGTSVIEREGRGTHNFQLGRQVLRVPIGDGSSNDGPSSPRLWPTPDAQVFNDGQSVKTMEARKRRELAKGYNGNGGGTTLAMEVRKGNELKKLNPAFVNWLMGLPPGWTGSGRSAMQLSLYVQRMRSLLLLRG